MNIREDSTIRAPSGKDDICAKFTIDTVNEPFVFHDIAEVGQEYTLSFYVKSSISASITIAGTAYPTLSEWVRYVINFTADAADLPIYFDSPGTYYLYNTQLEVGDKDTDFSLSPDDYSTTAQMEAYVDITSTNILSSVSQIYATKSEYEDLSGELSSFQQTWKQEATELIGSDYIINTVGNYYALNDDLVSAENRITTAESAIAQHTAEIALTVKEQDVTGDYLIGKINLDSTTAQIEAKNIDLSGYVTVSALGTAGATTIDGANITTGTISADRIDADGLFSKTVTATNLTVTGNSMLGGWNVTATRIKSSSSIYMGAAEAGFMIMNEANNCYLYAQNSSGTSTFQVTRDGYLVATGATINGSITATEGKIGPFTIDSDSLYTSVDNLIDAESYRNIYIGSDGVGFGASYLNSGGAIYVHSYDGTTTYIEGGYICTYNTSGQEVYILEKETGLIWKKNDLDIYEGMINITRDTANDTGMYAINTLRRGKFIVSNYGRLGIYDNTNSKWLIYSETTGETLNTPSNIYASGYIRSASELQSTYANGLRIAYGNYGFFIRNDGSNTYFLLTASGDTYGSWNSLRPMVIEDSTGMVTLNGRCVIPPSGAAANRPYSDNKYACGHTSYRYTYVYAASGVSTTSDEREKDILDLDLSEMSDYFMSLKPIAFRWNYGDDRKIRFGLGAQTSERKLSEAGYDPSLFAMIQHDELEVPSAAGLTDRYGLNYQEIQMLTMVQTQINTREIYTLKEWTDEISAEVASINKNYASLEAQVQSLKEQLAEANNTIAQQGALIEKLQSAA